MLQPFFAILVAGWIVKGIETPWVVRILGEDVVACLEVERVPLGKRYIGNLAEHALGDFLPVLIVVAPFAAGVLVPVH